MTTCLPEPSFLSSSPPVHRHAAVSKGYVIDRHDAPLLDATRRHRHARSRTPWIGARSARLRSRAVGAGEVNDYGTSGPVQALLWMHQLTGEQRYREAALNGADWLVDVLIETDEVVGWAGQYDADNQPLAARHHEPPAVTQYAPRWAADGLFAAWRATHNDKYLEPIRKVLAWFAENETPDGGWWWDYDIATGRPIEMYQRTIYFVRRSAAGAGIHRRFRPACTETGRLGPRRSAAQSA